MHDSVKYNSMTFVTFGKQTQGAQREHQKSTLPATTVECFRQHSEVPDADVQLADLHRSCLRHDLSFTCRLFVACVTSVSVQVCRESWDESNFQFSTNLCGTACYAGYKQSFVRPETKPQSLPLLHLEAHLSYSSSQTLNPPIMAGQGKG